MIRLQEGELELVGKMLSGLSGMSMESLKGYLVETRLSPIAEAAGCKNFNELYFRIRYGKEQRLTEQVVDAITTHETQWFRDGAPYDALQRDGIAEFAAARERMGQPKRLRIWSAACSSGQEPYGIAMVLRESIPDIDSWDVRIQASDISNATIEQAAAGKYSRNDIARTRRPDSMHRWLDATDDGAVVKPVIRNMVTFRKDNLLDPQGARESYDAIFLRNVLIYFEADVKKKVLENIRRHMLPHSWLIIGSTENISSIAPEWRTTTSQGATIYRAPSALSV
jgi:chemotaxis protein methyltransferase CheR